MSQKVTEKQAKTIWCRHGFAPFLHRYERTANCSSAATNTNRNSHGKPRCFCVASECMDWEWVPGPDGQGDKRVGFCDAQRGL